MGYSEDISKFGPGSDEEMVAGEVARIAALAGRNGNAAVWSACLGSVDLTSLGVGDSEGSVTEFVGRAARMCVDFGDLPPVASVCVWPSMVDVAGLALGGSRIAITSVAGGFPSSQTFIEVKMLEAAMAVESGADEIDIVISVGEMLAGEIDRMGGTLELLREDLGAETVLKVIIESGALKTPRLIRQASLAAMMAGADFVKTSTGKIEPAATPEAVVVMCEAIRDYHSATGRRVGIKVAGGVRTAADASLYYTIVEEILGAEWLRPELFRIGASSLVNNLLSAIREREIKYF
jgi:deoxyribose-phosphate aldolase